MARKYTFTDFKTKKILFETTQANYVGDEEINQLFKTKTGRDYRLEKGVIDRQIRTVDDK